MRQNRSVSHKVAMMFTITTLPKNSARLMVVRHGLKNRLPQ
jgi:hypothetical protein